MSCGNCFSLRQLLRRLPRQRRDQAGRRGREPERQRVRDRPRLLQGLPPLRRGVPLRRDRDGPRKDLTRGARMQQKVLIGYDDTPEGEDALGLGRRICEVLDARPLVATVISHPRNGADAGEFDRGGADVLRAVVRQGSRASRRSRRAGEADDQRLTGSRDLRADRLAPADRDRDRLDSPRNLQARAGRHRRRLAALRGAQHRRGRAARLRRARCRPRPNRRRDRRRLGVAARTLGRRAARAALERRDCVSSA